MFPIISSCIGTYARFCLKGVAMWVAFLIAAFSWLINNLIVGSLGGTLLEVTLIAVNSITICRLHKSKQAGVPPASYP